METENKFKCTICYEKYASLKDLEGHWAVHFRHYGPPEDNEATGSPEKNTESSKQELNRCNHCEFKTRLSFALKMHVRKFHVDHLNIEEGKHLDSNNSNDKTISRKFMAKPINKAGLNVREVNDNIKPYQCDLCEFKAGQIQRLQRHIKLVHIGLKDQKSPKCKFTTSNRDDLRRHISCVHDKII